MDIPHCYSCYLCVSVNKGNGLFCSGCTRNEQGLGWTDACLKLYVLLVCVKTQTPPSRLVIERQGSLPSLPRWSCKHPSRRAGPRAPGVPPIPPTYTMSAAGGREAGKKSLRIPFLSCCKSRTFQVPNREEGVTVSISLHASVALYLKPAGKGC